MESSNSSERTLHEKELSSDSSSGLTLVNVPSYSLSQEQQNTPIHTLPNELLDKIFGYLEIKQRIQSELVCKRWRWVGKSRPWGAPANLLFDPSRWGKTDMGYSFNLTDSILSDILRRCGSSLKRLTLSNRSGPEYGLNSFYQVSTTEAAIKLIGKHCPNLWEVEIGGIPLTPKSLKRLALGCRNLKTVRLRMFYSKRVNVEGLAGFYERCKNLESLTLELPNEIEGFEKLSAKLQVLRLERCAGKGLKPMDLTSIMFRCDYIRELGLSDYNEDIINPRLLLHVLEHYKNTLKVLETTICHPKRVSFNWCKALRVLNNLEKLTLCTLGIRHDCSHHVTGECFNETSKNLQFLDIRGSLYDDIDEPILIKLLKGCVDLRELRLSVCSNVSPEFLRCCTRFADTLRVLEAINVNSCQEQEWCETLACFLHLQELQLDFCTGISDQVLKHLSRGCYNLKSLRIRSTNVTDTGIFHLASLQYLAVVDLSNSPGVTGRGVEVLALQGHLEELYIATCSKRAVVNVNNENCKTLARFCQNFHFLDVSNVNGTMNISNDLVDAFGEGLQKGFLKRRIILVVGGTSITKEVQKYDRLEVLFEFCILLPRSFTRTRQRI